MPADFLTWTPSCHHNDAFKGMAKMFLNKPDYMKIPLFYIWGHSFEFEREQNWEQMEEFCKEISNQPDTWYTTNIDYVDYCKAAKGLIFSANGTKVENPSKIPVYGILDGKQIVL